MRQLMIVMVAALMLALLGCEAQSTSEPTGQGYVFEVRGDRVLVLDPLHEADLGKSWNEIFKDYKGEAIWLKTFKLNFKVGQKVKYWVDGGVDTSFPAQAKAKKIEVMDP